MIQKVIAKNKLKYNNPRLLAHVKDYNHQMFKYLKCPIPENYQ